MFWLTFTCPFFDRDACRSSRASQQNLDAKAVLSLMSLETCYASSVCKAVVHGLERYVLRNL